MLKKINALSPVSFVLCILLAATIKDFLSLSLSVCHYGFL